MRRYLSRRLVAVAAAAVAAAAILIPATVALAEPNCDHLTGSGLVASSSGCPDPLPPPPPINCSLTVTKPDAMGTLPDSIIFAEGKITCTGTRAPQSVRVTTELWRLRSYSIWTVVNSYTSTVANGRTAFARAFVDCLDNVGTFKAVAYATVNRGPNYVPPTRTYGPLTTSIADLYTDDCHGVFDSDTTG